MPKYAKHIALLAAFAMLCGCTGNTGSTQTSTAEAVQTAQYLAVNQQYTV